MCRQGIPEILDRQLTGCVMSQLRRITCHHKQPTACIKAVAPLRIAVTEDIYEDDSFDLYILPDYRMLVTRFSL